MDVMRVHAPSTAHASRLMASLDGRFTTSLNGDGSAPIVGLTVDSETATKLVELFDALGDWLTGDGLDSCRIAFGERNYTLLAARSGEPNDPTEFLLERTIQLQTALESRIVIEQAKGILAERRGTTPDEAFAELRSDARSRRMKLHELAADIVATAGAPAGDGLPR
jgi:hypothetical protein